MDEEVKKELEEINKELEELVAVKKDFQSSNVALVNTDVLGKVQMKQIQLEGVIKAFLTKNDFGVRVTNFQEAEIEKLNNSLKQVLEKIEKDTTISHEGLLAIYKLLDNFLIKVEKLTKPETFDYKQFKNILDSGVDSIIKILLSNNLMPDTVTYTRDNRTKKIVSVLEDYKAFQIKHNWFYDEDDDLIRVKSVRIDA